MSDTTKSPQSSQIQDILGRAGKYKRKQRLGRGEGSKGKTSGRGQKGAGARGGKPKRLGFEGGQTEIYRRFPQRGFSNFLFKTKYHTVNVSMLDRFDEGATVDREALKAAGLIPNIREKVKILGDGELKKKLTVKADAYSRNAHKLIVDAGGSAVTAEGGEYSFAEPRNARLSRKLDKRLARLGIQVESTSSDDDSHHDEAVSGDSGDVTSARESGTGTTTQADAPAPTPGGEASGGDSTAEAPESGTK